MSSIPSEFPFEWGSTFVGSLFYLLPGQIASRLFGPPGEVLAAGKFREIVGLSNPNHGVGYSLPAEGYLNFGIVGLVGVCIAYGLLLAVAYRKSDLVSGRVVGIAYLLLLAGLPMDLRAHSLGLMKGVAYSAILFAIGVFFARRLGYGDTRAVPDPGRSVLRPMPSAQVETEAAVVVPMPEAGVSGQRRGGSGP